MAGRVKLKGKNTSANTKSGIIGPWLPLTRYLSWRLITVNPRSLRKNKRHETVYTYSLYTKNGEQFVDFW